MGNTQATIEHHDNQPPNHPTSSTPGPLKHREATPNDDAWACPPKPSEGDGPHARACTQACVTHHMHAPTDRMPCGETRMLPRRACATRHMHIGRTPEHAERALWACGAPRMPMARRGGGARSAV